MMKSPRKCPWALLLQGLLGMCYYLDELLGRLHKITSAVSKVSCSRETSKSCQAVVLFSSSFLRMKVECSAFVLAQQESFLLKIGFLNQEGSQKLFLISYGFWTLV